MHEHIENQHNRTAILVLGMHRSGTSALTRCLNILGAALPERLMQSAPANPLGHFEPKEIVSIHDKILSSIGSSWSDWSQFPDDWYQSNGREIISSDLSDAIRIDYADSKIFAVKDPRLLRFIQLWRDILSGLNINAVAVLPYRNPIEVALSLKKRDQFPIEHGLLLWMRHVLDAEYHSRGIPRHFISYERLLENKQASIYNLIDALPIGWPKHTTRNFEEITEFLDKKLRRNVISGSELLTHKDLPDEIAEIYESYERLSVDPGNIEAMNRLDELRANFERASGLMSSTFRRLRERFESDNTLFAANNNRVNLLIEQAAIHDADLAVDRERTDALTAQVARYDADLAVDRERTDALIAQVARYDADIAVDRERTDALTAQVARYDADLAVDRERTDALAALVAQQEEHLNLLMKAFSELQAKSNSEFATVIKLKNIISNQSELILALQSNVPRMIGSIASKQRPYKTLSFVNSWKFIFSKTLRYKYRLFLQSGLFDSAWYCKSYRIDEKSDPLIHFVSVGSQKGYSPGPLFDAKWYNESNPDIVEQGIDPLMHYIIFGRNEGRYPLRQLSLIL